MRYTKGKWQAAKKDTYCVETTLNKIMLAHITKLYELIKDRDTVGIPMHYVGLQAEIQGVDKYSDDVDLDAAHQLRLRDLEELIWTYSDNEPNMDDYNFHIEMIFGKAEDAYWERKIAGYALAGKLWNNLSW